MEAYVSPASKNSLVKDTNNLISPEGTIYPIINSNGFLIPNFVNPNELNDSTALYNHKLSVDFYNNFKEWLFKTFGEDEQKFRLDILKRIIKGNEKRVLITGCGLGDDIQAILELTNFQAEVYATDISSVMLLNAAETAIHYNNLIHFSICDACQLPFKDDYFDVVFHFGGINLFDDIKIAISEMTRVVRDGGVVGFGDESVAPWLRNIDYGKMAIINNRLWSATPPLEKLPFEAVDVKLEWILGNCFYFVSFLKRKSGPYMDIDVYHEGPRGGTMRTRYYGSLEGISLSLKERVIEAAKKKNMSICDYLEQTLSNSL